MKNSVRSIFESICTILDRAHEIGINPYVLYKSRRFSASVEVVKKFALTYDELVAIYKLDLTGMNPSYDNIRDSFLIGAFSAMRFSDYSKLKSESINNGHIYRKTKKTGKHVIVPIHWVIAEIINKRSGNLPPAHSSHYSNVVVKELAKMAKINQKVVVSYTRSGKRIDEVKEKWEVVTTHTARRSGATNMIKNGIDRSRVKMFTGHESESSFSRYIDISEEDNAAELANHAFFKKPTVDDTKKTVRGKIKTNTAQI